MGIIKHLDIIPSIDPSLSSSEFIVEAGWGTISSIVGVIRLATSKPLKEAKIILEFQGESETFWVGSKVRKPGDPPGETFARRFQLVTTVVRDSKEALEPNEFGSITLPFKINLPAQGLPPSFTDSRGCIKYSLKSTLTWSETFHLLAPTHVARALIKIVMPRSHRLKLLQTPSTLEFDTVYDPNKCTCAIRLPTRVYIPGQQFTIQFAIPYVPAGRSVSAVQASIEANTTYRSVTSDGTKRNRNAVVWNPFPLAFGKEMPAPDEQDTSDLAHPSVFCGTIQLSTEAKYHQPTIESSIISSRSVVKFQVYLDGNEDPHVAFETAIVVIPADTIKETAALKALEIAREQIRPAHEIAASTSTHLHAQHVKKPNFTTTATITTRIPVNSTSDDGAPITPSSGPASPSLYGVNCFPESHGTHSVHSSRNTVASSNSGMYSCISSGDGFENHIPTRFASRKYSVSLRSLDAQDSQHSDTDTRLLKNRSAIQDSGYESVRLPSISKDPTSPLDIQTPDHSFATQRMSYEDDKDSNNLITIDELVEQLADVNLTRKDAGDPMFFKKTIPTQMPSDANAPGKTIVNKLIARLDSQHSMGFYESKVNTAPSNVVNETTDSTSDDETSTCKLKNLLDDLQDHPSKSLIKPHNASLPKSQVLLSKTRSTQIQQIDSLLESLLAFEQVNQTIEYDDAAFPASLASKQQISKGTDSTQPNNNSFHQPKTNNPKAVFKEFDLEIPLAVPQLSLQRPSIDIIGGPRTSADLRYFNQKFLGYPQCQSPLSVSHGEMQTMTAPTSTLFDALNNLSYEQKKAAKFIVMVLHTPHQPDELPLIVGDIVCIRKIFRDGWCWGYKVLTKSEGLFPIKKVQLYDPYQMDQL
ncbi:hypothetical protein BATDEDRAFT_26124 [Batrachochytrium dendrobatidis JAM81]|uniref:SH3 domain-containing protein n=1 Tax=Batrachochytrium dendrobatidis (strain JAM81 / FGSC 10211) TaxID=684364 RepID=F4P747_BATDJ|nr:uncharacterized protein BATDEDRAFT_26124 [Batrachochytrium dendrobatidis JAM81]EGF78987.1 hypothetical protein BATDEDRAFT_26124 [Batrachochytrium dendrobatidis JAM81]|eukprot:XP_006680311.1 hypothetical protein BATDEDRAFT_26124 [Batrachochytrium dendrobatidis JAM81]